MTDYYRVYGLASPGSVPFPVKVAGISNFIWVPAVGLLGTYVFLSFPDGTLPSRRWRPLAWLSGVVIGVLCIGVGLAPGPLPSLGGTRNPFGLEGFPWVETQGMSLCRYSLVYARLRPQPGNALPAFGGEEHQQIKWIAFAAQRHTLVSRAKVSA